MTKTRGLKSKASRKAWLKRQALQLAAMLPEDPRDARRVLKQALRMQDCIFGGDTVRPR